MADCKVKRCLYRHRRQPHQELQLERDGGDQGQGSNAQPMSSGSIETAEGHADPGRSGNPAHPYPRSCVIDGQDGIREPIGMSGMRLEVKAHIVTGAVFGGAEHRQMRAPLRPGGQ